MSEVVENEEKHRFELGEEGEKAVLTYLRSGETMTLTHTIVPPEVEGQGVGSRLVRGALDAVRERGLKVVPQCSFVRGFIERHPEYQELVAG